MAKSSEQSRDSDDSLEDFSYQQLVKIVRGHRYKNKREVAYNEIMSRILPKVRYISRQFYIPGCSYDDILQEALYALRFKAIPDYDPNKGSRVDPYPFDKFAVLCIRRHLSTLLKSSFQNKKKALNTSLSLDQDRASGADEILHLSDIFPCTEGTILGNVSDKEYFVGLCKKLYHDLSSLEKKVFRLYVHRYSYEEISERINIYYESKEVNKMTDIKSVDNALSRIKQKARDVYKKYGEEF